MKLYPLSPFISRCLTALTLTSLVSLTCATQAKASSFDDFVSGPGTAVYLGGGALLPLLTDGEHGGQHSLRVVDAATTSFALCYGLKQKLARSMILFLALVLRSI